MQEHHVDRILLKELMDLDVENEIFTAKAKVQREENGHHLEEEEEEHFPWLESLASEEELDALYEAYELAEHAFEEE